MINAGDKLKLITAEAALKALCQRSERYAFLDVRSQGEFAEGNIDGFANLPILDDGERHLVGTCYKQEGQEAAFALGERLTRANRGERRDSWAALAANTAASGLARELIVACWRGGARSRLCCEWLADAGVATLRVRGGYKAMRNLLRHKIETPAPLLVISGVTGCGKTRLLQELAVPKIDLEALANHRGSAFGERGVQPSQQQFENRLGLALSASASRYLVEDESRMIGRLEIPALFKQQMYAAPLVVLEASDDERLRITHAEYVSEPIQSGLTAAQVETQLLQALARIQRKLGDLRYRQLVDELQGAFANAIHDPEAHRGWIEPLLTEYYDPRYRHAFAKQPRQILCRGEKAEVSEFCRSYLSK